MSELLDVVNNYDEVIAQLERDEVYRQGLNFRVINAFLINSRNEVWVPRRAAHKKLFPLCLDASVGGHVSAGESYEQAFEREVEEEVGLKPGTYKYDVIGKLTHLNQRVSAFMVLYIIHTNSTPAYSPNDFIADEWMPVASLIQKIKEGDPAKGDLLTLAAELERYLFTESL